MSNESPPRRRIVVDGSNIATEGRTLPSLAQLDEAIRTFLDEFPGFTTSDVTVVVDASFGHRIDPSEVADFEEAVLHGEMVTPPAGAVGRGDGFILRIAEKSGALVLSNDSFQEFHAERPWLFDEGRLIGGKPVPGIGWVFTPRTPVRGPKSRAVTSRSRRDAKIAASDGLMSDEQSVASGDGPDDRSGSTEQPRSKKAEKVSKAGKGGKAPKAAKTAKTEKSPKASKASKPSKSSKADEPAGSPAGKPAKAVKVTKASKTSKASKSSVKAVASSPVAEPLMDHRTPEPAGNAGRGSGGRSESGRRPAGTAPAALNDPMTFLTFVADHPVGSTVEGTVVSFTSHGAHVDVGAMRCHVPLQGLANPPPIKARDVVSKGETRQFILVSLDAARRRAELALPGVS
jgi:Zc3h12a-like Ribonuclease NYN domain/S1 RNA binding domain